MLKELLLRGQTESQPKLQAAWKAAQGPERFWIAVGLAWWRDASGLDEILSAIEERRALDETFTPMCKDIRPLWESCLMLVQRLGSDAKYAYPTVREVLLDEATELDARIAAVKTLAAIGTEDSLELLRRVPSIQGRSFTRFFRINGAEGRWPPSEDGRWQLDLAAAHALIESGENAEELLAPYQEDPRPYVRRYVQRLRNCLQPGPAGSAVESILEAL